MIRSALKLRAVCALSLPLVAAAGLPAGIPRGLFDHSLCCGPRPSSIHGEGTMEDFEAMVARRHRIVPPVVVAPPLPAPAVVIPGSDTFVRETGGTTPATDPLAPAAPAAADARTPTPNGDTPAVAPAPEEPVAFPPLERPTERVQGHLRVGFDVLGGFPFQLTRAEAAASVSNPNEAATKALAQIPPVVRELDGQKVLVTGFMLPMKMEGTLATEFLLVANSMLCCYGVVPPMNQWMVVKMRKGGAAAQHDVPVQVFGTLRVEPRYDNGALSAIYHLDGDRVRKP
jgi:hypothetical protein